MSNRAAGPERDLVGYGAHPPKVVWPNGAAVALSPIVAYEEGSEYGHTWGDDRNEGVGKSVTCSIPSIAILPPNRSTSTGRAPVSGEFFECWTSTTSRCRSLLPLQRLKRILLLERRSKRLVTSLMVMVTGGSNTGN